jgi:hypothetical protein
MPDTWTKQPPARTLRNDSVTLSFSVIGASLRCDVAIVSDDAQGKVVREGHQVVVQSALDPEQIKQLQACFDALKAEAYAKLGYEKQ